MTRKKQAPPQPPTDLAGRKVGKFLTVESYIGRRRVNDRADHAWLCRCSCGGSRTMMASRILSAIDHVANPSCRACRATRRAEQHKVAMPQPQDIRSAAKARARAEAT